MARVTVEDCLEKVDNRFQLVLMASHRARKVALGSEALLPWEGDKPTVLALREIAEGKVGPEVLDEPLVEESEFDFESVSEPSSDQPVEGAEEERPSPRLPEGSEGAEL